MRSRRMPLVLICLTLLLVTRAVDAQYIYQPGQTGDPATGEVYYVEFGVNLWSPTPEILVSSEAFGIVGTPIDLIADLSIEKKRLPEFRLTLRPTPQHKFRLHYIPIEYTTQTVLETTVVFNGIRYDVGVPVDARLTWNAWRFAYEYDLLVRDRGFFGVIVEAKYTNVETNIDATFGQEFSRARAPVPTLGAIGRVYVVPNIAITAEFTGIALPKFNQSYEGHFYDFDIYGTVNFTNELGVQIGYRSMDVEYRIDQDTGDFLLKGFYFGGVVRF